MTNLIRWDPLTDMRMALDRLYDEGFTRPWRALGTEGEASMPVEISDSEDAIEIKAQLPGVKAEDINITVSNDILNIKAEHREDRDDKEKNYVRHEIRYGSMQRSISLPGMVNTENAEATFENGVLRLKLPKAAEMKQRRIQVNSGGSSGPQQISGEASEGQPSQSSSGKARAA